MDETGIQKKLEQLSEGVVLCDVSDLQALAGLHTLFQETEQCAAEEILPEVSTAARQAAALIEKIILDEVDNPDDTLQIVGAAVSAMQSIVRDGRSAEEAGFPPELELCETDTDASAPVDRPSGAPPAPTDAGENSDPAPEGRDPSSDQPQALEGDVDILGEFVGEASDHLEASDVHLLTLETAPQDEEALNAVFRAFHTIKGVAGFLALEDIQSLAHEAESLLDKARKGEIALSGPAIDVTFDAVDAMKRLVGHVEHSLGTGEPLAREGSLDALTCRLRAAAAGEAVVGEDADEDLSVSASGRLGDILVELGVATWSEVEAALKKQEGAPERVRIGEILVSAAVASRKEIEAALEKQRERGDGSRLGEILVELGVASADEIEAALERQAAAPRRKRLGEILVHEKAAPAKDVAHALRSQKAAATRRKGSNIKEMIKIDTDRLDRMVNAIGELVIAESMVSQTIEDSGQNSDQLETHLGQLNKMTRELQEMATSLRMVPVRSTFQKMARVARDTAKKLNKKIEFVLSGEETEIDKTLVDKMADPLVHMIRNAVDHGIENTPEERLRAGKDERGRVCLRAFHRGGNIYIEVEDDGRGLDREKLLAAARDRGLSVDSDSMSDREVFNLVLEAGFSTATRVTEVSGRGVGMDVVRKSIEALHGRIEIRSELTRGSVFSIRLPLTIAIIDGVVMRVGSRRYIIPIMSIVRFVRPSPEDLKTVLGSAEMLSVDGELVPLLRLGRLLRVDTAGDDLAESVVVVVESDGERVGVLVDELLGQQQVVIKNLGPALQGAPGTSGGAIMPDGRVGLILDVAGLMGLARSQGGRSPGAESASRTGQLRAV